jgi:uncharacterized protein YerC
MAKVSELPLREDVWERVFRLFVDTISGINNKKKLEDFINDFFSPTERIMFAKRLALMMLLAKNHNYQNIRNILKISPPTIAKMSLKVKYGGKGLHPVINDVFKKQISRILWKEIESIIDIPTKSSLKSPERNKRILQRKQKIEEIKKTF